MANPKLKSKVQNKIQKFYFHWNHFLTSQQTGWVSPTPNYKGLKHAVSDHKTWSQWSQNWIRNVTKWYILAEVATTHLKIITKNCVRAKSFMTDCLETFSKASIRSIREHHMLLYFERPSTIPSCPHEGLFSSLKKGLSQLQTKNNLSYLDLHSFFLLADSLQPLHLNDKKNQDWIRFGILNPQWEFTGV